MPPKPITGTLTALETCQTIRKAIGLMAGPDNPPVTVESIGILLSASIAIPRKVFTKETLSAPPATTAFAISAISVTLGDNLTISVLLYTFLTSDVTLSAITQLVPKAIPPCFTLGQEIFNSIALIFSNSFIRSAKLTYSSIDEPFTFTMTFVLY